MAKSEGFSERVAELERELVPTLIENGFNVDRESADADAAVNLFLYAEVVTSEFMEWRFKKSPKRRRVSVSLLVFSGYKERGNNPECDSPECLWSKEVFWGKVEFNPKKRAQRLADLVKAAHNTVCGTDR
jgi:hypothetical protein